MKNTEAITQELSITSSIKELDNSLSDFKTGEELIFVKVRFPGNAKALSFYTANKKYQYGQQVIAMSDRGLAIGRISSFPYKQKFSQEMLPMDSIVRVATEKDFENDRKNKEKEREVKTVCEKLVEKLELNMEITHVEYTQFGKKVVFYFVAPERVDFRNLVKELVSSLKMRIELRQIHIRDRAAGLGGIGPCGLQVCCQTFNCRFASSTMKMAKNQNLTLTPGKLNGLCGQLKCCLQYEDDVYTENRKILPKEGQQILTKNGDFGQVLKVFVLQKQFEMLTDQGQKRRYSYSQYLPALPVPANKNFPEKFQHIIDETYEIIS